MQGRVTRGKTRPGRLALLDRWLLAQDVLDGRDAPFLVDVGIGGMPDTTVELFEAVRPVCPRATVLGTDLDPVRVSRAERRSRPGLSFATRGFDLDLAGPAAAIRAMNILRQYRPEQVAEAHRQLGGWLAEDGLLLEGTSSPTGDVMCVHALRRTGPTLRREALVFGCTSDRGFAPLMLRDRLPRDLRDRVRPDHPLGGFFDRWTAAWEAARAAEDSPAEAFRRSVLELARRGEPVDIGLVDEGIVSWRPPDGVPERGER